MKATLRPQYIHERRKAVCFLPTLTVEPAADAVVRTTQIIHVTTTDLLEYMMTSCGYEHIPVDKGGLDSSGTSGCACVSPALFSCCGSTAGGKEQTQSKYPSPPPPAALKRRSKPKDRYGLQTAHFFASTRYRGVCIRTVRRWRRKVHNKMQ